MQTTNRRKSQLGLMIIVGTLTILAFILAVALAVLFATSQFGAGSGTSNRLLTGTSPLTSVDVGKVDPALALASLGGVPDAEVITQALNKARPETALAAALYSPALLDKESAGSLLLLAAAYTAQKPDAQAMQKAGLCYKLAGAVATLSPAVSDTARADVFIQAGEGFIELGQPNQAKFYLAQAFLIAERSPFLQAVHRRAIFERLQKDFIILNERELARASLNLSANPPPVATFLSEEPVLPKPGPIALPEQVQTAEAKRWRHAQELAAIMVERGGKAPQATQTALREALITEDQQKLAFYEEALTSAARVSKKIEVMAAKIEWLSIKYRVARQAYGISLVPEWEAQAEQIRADLTKSYEAMFALYSDLIVALPDVAQIDRATTERLRREVLAGELGRYPNYPEEQRQKQLLEAMAQLMALQPELRLTVGVDILNDQAVYKLVAGPEQSGP
jgi:hypothetical protein